MTKLTKTWNQAVALRAKTRFRDIQALTVRQSLYVYTYVFLEGMALFDQ